MTNLEFYKDEIVKMIRKGHTLGCCVCHVMNKIGENSPCEGYKCTEEKFCDWLLEEHKEPIKLKQWEYDLLTIFENHTVNDKLTLDSAIIIAPMLRSGYFQGVPNTSMTIKEIIENCEVVEND